MSGSDYSKFAVGDHVRARPGVADFDYPDMPLGGWAGTVAEVQEDASSTYLVRWSPRTLGAIHPAYRARCEQDGIDFREKWFDEDDLELDEGDPPAVEQPGEITSHVLSAGDQEDRIRAVFGAAGEEPLPAVDRDAILTYYEHLASGLSFPFLAERVPGTERAGPTRGMPGSITVIRLLGKDRVDQRQGIVCRVADQRGEWDVPLSEIQVDAGSPNYQLIDDYCRWFGNRH